MARQVFEKGDNWEDYDYKNHRVLDSFASVFQIKLNNSATSAAIFQDDMVVVSLNETINNVLKINYTNFLKRIINTDNSIFVNYYFCI